MLFLAACGDGFCSSCLDQNLVYSWNRPLRHSRVLSPIYTTQLLPKTVACNMLTTWVVLPRLRHFFLIFIAVSAVVEMDIKVNNPRLKENCQLFNITTVTVRGKPNFWIELLTFSSITVFIQVYCRFVTSAASFSFLGNSKWNTRRQRYSCGI
jgi:hypothetical protein